MFNIIRITLKNEHFEFIARQIIKIFFNENSNIYYGGTGGLLKSKYSTKIIIIKSLKRKIS